MYSSISLDLYDDEAFPEAVDLLIGAAADVLWEIVPHLSPTITPLLARAFDLVTRAELVIPGILPPTLVAAAAGLRPGTSAFEQRNAIKLLSLVDRTGTARRGGIYVKLEASRDGAKPASMQLGVLGRASLDMMVRVSVATALYLWA